MKNFPNPFNSRLTIESSSNGREHVEVQIFDPLGREINTLVDEQLSSGVHRVVWNATDNRGVKVSSGIYFYEIQAVGQTENFIQTRKMVLLP